MILSKLDDKRIHGKLDYKTLLVFQCKTQTAAIEVLPTYADTINCL
jgi:hypothetical protein